MADPRSRPYDIITFDCYGTLIDWETGIADAFRDAAAADGVRLDPAAAQRALREKEPESQAAAYRSYRDVLTETAMVVADKPRWKPFADTIAALTRLSKAGYDLGILSNVDDDLLAGTRRHLAVEFSLLVTAQQVRSYKPAPGHFTTARERIGARRWLHAAQSYFHDVTPAVAHRIPVAWINRKAEPPTGAARPDREFRTLTELADWLTATRSR